MKKRNYIITGNWKMNLKLKESHRLTESIIKEIPKSEAVKVVLCPPFTALNTVHKSIDKSRVQLGGQNLYPEKYGAFTGEISPEMLTDIGCKYVIIGHSERRQYFQESNEFINKKIKTALQHSLTPIFCVGETQEERNSKNTFKILKKQLSEGLKDISNESNFIIAYEPVWAIGTGNVATPEQAQEVHQFIRSFLTDQFNANKAESTTIQYGGSVNAKNSLSLLSKPDIDGALIGGASLKSEAFLSIINDAISLSS